MSIKENDEELLSQIGVFSYIKSMPKDFIFNRMMYGRLGKRSKGKIKYFQ